MRIRTAIIKDAEEIHRIHTSAVLTTCKNFYTEQQVKAWLKGRSPEGYYTGIRNGEMYVAEEDGQISGFGHAVSGKIEACYVDPKFHKQGVGKLLIEHGLKIASDGDKKVTVESTINAENFYKKHGFKKIKNSTTTRNNIELPTVIMELPEN